MPVRFDPVTDRIAQHVHHRVFQRLKNHAVGLHLQPGDAELDLLVLVLRHVADHLSKNSEYPLGRHHARLADIFLELLAENAHRTRTALLQRVNLARLARNDPRLSLDKFKVVQHAREFRRGTQPVQMRGGYFPHRFPFPIDLINVMRQLRQRARDLVLAKAFGDQLARRPQQAIEMLGVQSYRVELPGGRGGRRHAWGGFGRRNLRCGRTGIRS